MKGCDVGVLVGFIDRLFLPDEAEEIPDYLTRCSTCFDAAYHISNQESRAIFLYLPFSQASPSFCGDTSKVLPFRSEEVPLEFDMPFVTHMIEHLSSVFPHRWSAGKELKRFIFEGIRKASRYGVYLEEDVGLYLELASVYGGDFDTNPQTGWAGEILNDPHLSGSEKMDRLDSYEIFELPFEQKKLGTQKDFYLDANLRPKGKSEGRRN